MEINDIQFNHSSEKVEITFVNEDVETIIDLKISIRDAKMIAEFIKNKGL